MRRLVMVGAVVLLAASGCIITVTPTPTVGPRMVVASPGRTFIASGVYAVSAMPNVLWHGNYYYKLIGSNWYRSHTHQSGWVGVSTVPSAFRSIPHGHPSYHMVRHVPVPHILRKKSTGPTVRRRVRATTPRPTRRSVTPRIPTRVKPGSATRAPRRPVKDKDDKGDEGDEDDEKKK